jgi:hypothetical protein
MQAAGYPDLSSQTEISRCVLSATDLTLSA